MRRIVKTHAPAQLTAWRRANCRGPNYGFGHLPGAVKSALKVLLLREQGYLCAYTGRRIGDGNSHIEHLKPQHLCETGEDVDYFNVVGAFPLNGGDKAYGYGAPVKDNWWDSQFFVSPTDRYCEYRFSFSWSGKIGPAPSSHDGAKMNIDKLGLNNKGLRDLRRAAIRGFFGLGRNPITKAEAQTLLGRVDNCDGNGCLLEYCFALKQLLPRYIAGK